MEYTKRPDIRVSKMLKRLPPDVADEVVEDFAEYIQAVENGVFSELRNTSIGRYLVMTSKGR